MKVGSRIRIDGKTAKVVSRYASGKHVNFVLDDGRTVLDLHLREDVTIEPDAVPRKTFKDDLPSDVVNGEDWQD